MTRHELRAAGEALYGTRWQTALARELGVADRTVRRWAAGKIAIGERATREVNRLLAMQGGRPLGSPSLAHVTLNTGNLVHSPRDQILADTAAWLAPMVAAGRGEPAGIRFVIDQRSNGAALLHIGEPPAVLCGVCWDGKRSIETWAAMLALMSAQGMERGPGARPDVPWLAVLMLPAMFALPPETVMMLGDMERCLAWTIIEAGG